MKNRILLTMLLALVSLCTKAQVYDGITQPTRWRVFVPVTTSLNASHKTTIAPFVGFKQDFGERFSITPVAQYNINNEAFIAQVWLNFNVDKKFYILSRSIYNMKAKLYTHTLSATYKLPMGFMIDGTWDNLYNGRKFCDGDRLQFVGGWAWKMFVVNTGYSCRAAQGFIANLRWKVTDYNWLQLKYDGGAKSIQISAAFQFN